MQALVWLFTLSIMMETITRFFTEVLKKCIYKYEDLFYFATRRASDHAGI